MVGRDQDALFTDRGLVVCCGITDGSRFVSIIKIVRIGRLVVVVQSLVMAVGRRWEGLGVVPNFASLAPGGLVSWPGLSV